jgi:hypothetical protein
MCTALGVICPGARCYLDCILALFPISFCPRICNKVAHDLAALGPSHENQKKNCFLNSILLPGIYAPPTKNIFRIANTKWLKKLHVHLHNLCAFASFHEKKPNIFCVLCKKDKKYLITSLILGSNLVFEFSLFTQKMIFMKQLVSSVRQFSTVLLVRRSISLYLFSALALNDFIGRPS